MLVLTVTRSGNLKAKPLCRQENRRCSCVPSGNQVIGKLRPGETRLVNGIGRSRYGGIVTQLILFGRQQFLKIAATVRRPGRFAACRARAIVMNGNRCIVVLRRCFQGIGTRRQQHAEHRHQNKARRPARKLIVSDVAQHSTHSPKSLGPCVTTWLTTRAKKCRDAPRSLPIRTRCLTISHTLAKTLCRISLSPRACAPDGENSRITVSIARCAAT